jgi:hypothetical protein
VNPNEVAEATLEELIKARHALDCLAETVEAALEHYTGSMQHKHHQNPPEDEPEDEPED